MLESSPVALPPVPRPLKRSASTASLPTPPRTRHKRKTSRSSVHSDSDSDTDQASGSDNEGVYKKRRTGEAKDEDDEDAFWLGPSSTTKKKSTDGSVKDVSSRPPSPAPLIYRKLQKQTVVAPVSPPPSNRKPPAPPVVVTPKARPVIPALRTVSPPVTPKAKGKFPMRDSPDNPFLESPEEGTNESGSDAASPGPKTPLQEKPTVTYVFRGVRGVFPNPMYNHAKNRPLSPTPNSLLPTEHPDFSPDPGCPPRLLFPSKKRRSARLSKRDTSVKRSEKALRRSLSPGFDSGDEGAEVHGIKPIKLDFGKHVSRTKDKVSVKDQPSNRTASPPAS